MALDVNALSNALHDNLTPKADGYGRPVPVTDATASYAAGVIASLKAALVSSLPGTINGLCAPGSPLAFGVGLGTILMTPAPMIAKTINGFGVIPPDLVKENTALIAYITTGIVNFPSGGITGTCTSTPVSGGPLLNGAGAGGQITLLTGVGAYAAVLAALGFLGPSALKHYTILIDYIKDNAIVTYPLGTVLGTCPPASGPLIGGFATGGFIT